MKQRLIEYRASVALATCGVLIASILAALGPGFGDDRAGPARAVPASAGSPEVMIPIDRMSGLFLAARLPMRRWPWIGLGLFVAGVWGAAAVLAARRVAMGRPTTAPSPTNSATRDARAGASKVEFASLFDEFLDMRSRCGDVGDVPNFEEFARSLQRQRATMRAMGRSRAVSFHVAFVDGHAVVRVRTSG